MRSEGRCSSIQFVAGAVRGNSRKRLPWFWQMKSVSGLLPGELPEDSNALRIVFLLEAHRFPTAFRLNRLRLVAAEAALLMVTTILPLGSRCPAPSGLP